jgi:hypothetical protein
MSVLVEIYDLKFSSFINKEIISGKPIVKKEEKTSQPKSIYYDIIEKEKEKNKNPKDETEDQNYLVNK